MAAFIQIFLLNLAVSCDNVGVIALATRNLPEEKMVLARRLGVGLSLVLKMAFILVVGYLFRVSWLHIRLVGGVLLLYVTFHMLRQNLLGTSHRPERRGQGADGFLSALVAIVAADVSMSLDNVIAILSIVAADGREVGAREMLLVLGALLLSVPVLLWLSGTVSRWMEQYPVLVCICAGYLGYIALRMLFEDDLLVLFFQQIRFTLTTHAAVLGGVVTGLYGLSLAGGRSPVMRRTTGLLLAGCAAVGYSLVAVAVMTYVSTNPMLDGHIVTPAMRYGFELCGANAVYAIGSAAELPVLCCAVYVGVLANSGSHSYGGMLLRSVGGMMFLVLVELAVVTAGMTASFGFGELRIIPYLTALLLQLGLLCIYPAAFCLVGAYVQGKVPWIAVGMLLVLLEGMLEGICLHSRMLFFLTGLSPDFYLGTMSLQMQDPGFALRAGLVIAGYLGLFVLLGIRRCRKMGGYGAPVPALSGWGKI